MIPRSLLIVQHVDQRGWIWNYGQAEWLITNLGQWTHLLGLRWVVLSVRVVRLVFLPWSVLQMTAGKATSCKYMPGWKGCYWSSSMFLPHKVVAQLATNPKVGFRVTLIRSHTHPRPRANLAQYMASRFANHPRVLIQLATRARNATRRIEGPFPRLQLSTLSSVASCFLS